MIPALQGDLIDTVHMTVSVQENTYGNGIGSGVNPGAVISMPADVLVEAASETMIAGKLNDVQPNL